MTQEIHRGTIFEIDRGATKSRAGQGLIKGLAVVWNHWSKSWTKKLTNMSDTEGIFTVQYPEERLVLPEAYRNMPVLLYDDETGYELCTACLQCERICPPQVIHIEQAQHPDTGKPIPVATEFTIEYDACMSCGLCAEVCPFESIKMDHNYELSTWDHPSLTMHKRALMRPISYYATIAPDKWQAAKDNAYKKLDGTKKRRVGTLGIAEAYLANPPQQATRTEQFGNPTDTTITTAAKPASSIKRCFSADNLMGGVPANTTMSEEKKAKLRSIRHGNLHK